MLDDISMNTISECHISFHHCLHNGGVDTDSFYDVTQDSDCGERVGDLNPYPFSPHGFSPCSPVHIMLLVNAHQVFYLILLF